MRDGARRPETRGGLAAGRTCTPFLPCLCIVSSLRTSGPATGVSPVLMLKSDQASRAQKAFKSWVPEWSARAKMVIIMIKRPPLTYYTT